MQCFRCDQPATQECARCGALYCDDHGDVLCARCMDPGSALPSYRVYRGSLLALLIGSIFAVWLLVKPAGEADQAGAPAALAAVLPSTTSAPTLAPTGRALTATVAPSTATPTVTAVPPTPTATPPPATSTPANHTYTVRSGDTLYSIADDLRGGTDLPTFLNEIYSLNGLHDGSVINPGDVIKIPS